MHPDTLYAFYLPVLAGAMALFVWTLRVKVALSRPRTRNRRLRVVPGITLFRDPVHPFTADSPRYAEAW